MIITYLHANRPKCVDLVDGVEVNEFMYQVLLLLPHHIECVMNYEA